jgi:hypothetical protein
VLRRGVSACAPRNTPDASRIDRPEGLAIPAALSQETSRNEPDQRPEDPSPRAPLQIKRSFAAVATPDPRVLRCATPPDPRTLCCGCRSRPGDPSLRRRSEPEGPDLRLQLRTRGSFAAPHLRIRRPIAVVAGPGPRALHRPHRRIRGPFAAVAGPGPEALRRAADPNPKARFSGCNSKPEGPLLRHIWESEEPSMWVQVRARRPFAATPLRVRRPFAACAPPSPRTLRCALKDCDLK